MFVDDFDKNGTQDLVMSVYNFRLSGVENDDAEQVPWWEKIQAYKQFAWHWMKCLEKLHWISDASESSNARFVLLQNNAWQHLL